MSDGHPISDDELVPEQRGADGVGAVAVGTALWGIAFVVLLVMRDQLEDDDREWWIWVCLAGLVLGLPGLWYVRRRRAAYRRAARP